MNRRVKVTDVRVGQEFSDICERWRMTAGVDFRGGRYAHSLRRAATTRCFDPDECVYVAGDGVTP